jgi:hypothetical protein
METRNELDGFFKKHGVYLNYSIDDLERDTCEARIAKSGGSHSATWDVTVFDEISKRCAS